MNPKLLFVSEPTRGIDIGAKKLVLETLVRLNREKGMTVVMVSSELMELRSICGAHCHRRGGQGGGRAGDERIRRGFRPGDVRH